MSLEDYKTRDSVILVFTGDGKGKTSASLGLMARALGAGWRVAYFQFIKKWKVNDQAFINKIAPIFGDNLYFCQGGAGFFNAKGLSAKNVSKKEHKKAAKDTFNQAFDAATTGAFDLVICDEINNALADGLLDEAQIGELIEDKSPKTSLCLTGRNFPKDLLPMVDIATDMKKIKHHFDDKFLANPGIDY